MKSKIFQIVFGFLAGIVLITPSVISITGVSYVIDIAEDENAFIAQEIKQATETIPGLVYDEETDVYIDLVEMPNGEVIIKLTDSNLKTETITQESEALSHGYYLNVYKKKVIGAVESAENNTNSGYDRENSATEQRESSTRGILPTREELCGSTSACNITGADSSGGNGGNLLIPTDSDDIFFEEKGRNSTAVFFIISVIIYLLAGLSVLGIIIGSVLALILAFATKIKKWKLILIPAISLALLVLSVIAYTIINIAGSLTHTTTF